MGEHHAPSTIKHMWEVLRLKESKRNVRTLMWIQTWVILGFQLLPLMVHILRLVESLSFYFLDTIAEFTVMSEI